MLGRLLLLSKVIAKTSAKNKLVSLAAIVGADSIKKEDIAFLPLADAIKLYNEKNIDHENNLDSYFSLSSMNNVYPESIPLTPSKQNPAISVHDIYMDKFPSGILIKMNGEYIGASFSLILTNGEPNSEYTIYYSDESMARKLKIAFPESNLKRVKYIRDYINEITNASGINKAKYNNLLQNMVISGNKIQIRTGQSPIREDYGDSIVAMNEEGLIVGMASDEWGATLISVAQEYRGMGIGTVLSRLWKEINPSYRSGGFSYGGLSTFKRVWAMKVRDHLSNGTFSDALSKGILSKEVLKKIIEDYRYLDIDKGETIKDLGKREVEREAEKEYLFIYPNNSGFILFSNKFFEEEDDKYIYAEGRIECSEHVGCYVYSLDYSSDREEIASRLIMQVAKNGGINHLYNDQGYSDFISISGINEASIVSKKINDGSSEREYIEIGGNTMPNIRSMIFNKSMLPNVDKFKYDEMIYTLIESAHKKDW
jgi:hypothetical protein